MKRLGSIEAGGTKFICAVSDENLNILAKTKILTTLPEKTMPQIFRFFSQNKPDAIGIGCFGPIGIDEQKDTYGKILATPKKGWVNYPFLTKVKSNINVPTFWTTDVNTAAFGEHQIGAGKGLENVVYWTVGTGIGAGAIVANHLLCGKTHPEMGHMLIRRSQYELHSGRL